jgi:hypothetical protein
MKKDNIEDKSISVGRNIEGSNLVSGDNNQVTINNNFNVPIEKIAKEQTQKRSSKIWVIVVSAVLSLIFIAWGTIRSIALPQVTSAEEHFPTAISQVAYSDSGSNNAQENPPPASASTGQEGIPPASAISLLLEETVNQSINIPGDNRIFVYEAQKPEVVRIELIEKDKGGYFHPEGTILFNGESLNEPLNNVTPNIVALPSAGTYTIVIKAGKKAKFEETGDFAITIYSLDDSNPKAKFLQSGQPPISGTLEQYGNLEVYFYNAAEDGESLSITRSSSGGLDLTVTIYDAKGNYISGLMYGNTTLKLDEAGTYAIVVAPRVTAGSVDYGDFTIKLDKLP